MLNKLGDLLLRARHWQLFLLLYALPWIGQAALILSFRGPSLSPGVGAISVAVDFLVVCWFWTVGTFLNSITQPDLQLRTRFLEFASIFTVLNTLCLFAWMTYLQPEVDFVMLSLGVVDFICKLYLAHFAAKSLAQAETGKPLRRRNYWKMFLLFLFYPVGIWALQPKINRLYAANLEAGSSLSPGEA